MLLPLILIGAMRTIRSGAVARLLRRVAALRRGDEDLATSKTYVYIPMLLPLAGPMITKRLRDRRLNVWKLLPLAGPIITMSVDWPEIQFT